MKQLLLFLVLVGFLSQIQVVKAEVKDTSLVLKVLKHGLTDTKQYLLSPIKWDKKDWLLAGGISAATGALIAWGDQPIFNFSNTLQHKSLDDISSGLRPMGNGYLYLTMSAFLVSGIISKNNYAFETGLIAAESYAFTGVFCQAVKVSTGRSRPNDLGNTNSHMWNGPFFKGNSFFSGHSTSAFSVASVVAYRYWETTWVPILSYGMATLCGLQRIYDNRHWASDVFMGATIGTVTGIFLCKQWESKSIKFYPNASPTGAGLSVIIPIK
jgi:membrane-associated phospholipid phosphatase